jgi:hypothetical protein
MSTLPIVNEYGKRDKKSGYITLTPKSNSLRTVFYFTFPKTIKKDLYDLSFQLTARTKIGTTQDYTWEAFNVTSNDWVTIDSLGAPCKRAIWCSETYTLTGLNHFLSTEKKVALRVTSDGSVALQIDHLTAFVLPKVFVVDDSHFSSKSDGTTFEFYFPSSADGASVRAVVSLPPSSSSCPASKKRFSAVVLLHGSGGLWKDRRSELGLNPQFKDWRKVYNSNCWFGMYLDSFTPRGVVEQSDPNALPFNIKIAPPFIRARDALTGLSWLKKMMHTNGVDNWVHDAKIGVQGFGDGGSSAEGAVFDIDASPADQLWSYDQTYYADDGVLAPPRADLSNGFRAAVAYYPGSEHQGYYGDPCTLPPSPDAGTLPFLDVLFPILWFFPFNP